MDNDDKSSMSLQSPMESDVNTESEEDAVPMVLRKGQDGKLERVPASPAQIERAAKNEEFEVHAVEEANDVLALLDPISQVHVLSGTVQVGDKNLLFHFRVLSFSECSALEAKKYRRGKNGQIVRDVNYEQTNSTAWLIHWCVVKNENEGKTGEAQQPLDPKWVSMFTLAEIRDSIMGNSDAKALQLLYGLSAWCWEVNPSTNPLLAAQALQQMG